MIIKLLHSYSKKSDKFEICSSKIITEDLKNNFYEHFHDKYEIFKYRVMTQKWKCTDSDD